METQKEIQETHGKTCIFVLKLYIFEHKKQKYIINDNYFILIDMHGLGKILEDDFRKDGEYIFCVKKSDQGGARIPLASTRLGSKLMSLLL